MMVNGVKKACVFLLLYFLCDVRFDHFKITYFDTLVSLLKSVGQLKQSVAIISCYPRTLLRVFTTAERLASDNPQEMGQGVQISMPGAIGEKLACFEYSI